MLRLNVEMPDAQVHSLLLTQKLQVLLTALNKDDCEYLQWDMDI
jgi:hypothetical protein